MKNRRLSSIAFASALGTLGVVLACCTGGTDGSGDEDFSGGQFVGSDSTTGRMVVNVLDTDMSVSDTSGFGVAVTNSLGQPVSGIKVSCDSEEGIAILEPTNGGEITDGAGNISGVIGCAAPGSYQFACRLPVGTNKRQLVTVICRGPVPTGFTGFEGAAGGGLGGGTDDSDSGGVGGSDSAVRITNLGFADDGSAPSADLVNFAIDVSQGICDPEQVGAGTPTPIPDAEPFFDTTLGVKVINNGNQTVRFSSMTYRVVDIGGSIANNGSDFVSDSIAILGEAGAIAGGGGEGELIMLAFNATGGGKQFFGSSTDIPSSTGFKEVRVTLNGTNDSGENIQATASITLDFGNFDRCG